MRTQSRTRFSDRARARRDGTWIVWPSGRETRQARLAIASVVGAAATLFVANDYVRNALSATPEWTVSDGYSRAVAEQPAARRQAVQLGLGGDVPLSSPIATGRVIIGRDAIAALASDRALAGAAFFASEAVQPVTAPLEDDRPSDRVASIVAADLEALNNIETSALANFDVELARQLNISYLGGVDRTQTKNAEKELECLAEAIYFEARSEPLEGQVAVAEVVLNRVDSSYWPDTICGVVNQGSKRRNGCQFSYTCDGLPERIGDDEAYTLAERIAELMMKGAPRRVTDHATHYHADYVSPKWAQAMELTAVVGRHRFFRRLIRFATREAEN